MQVIRVAESLYAEKCGAGNTLFGCEDGDRCRRDVKALPQLYGRYFYEVTDDREHDAQVAKKDERSVVVGSFNGCDRIVEYAFLAMSAVRPVDAAFAHEAVAREDAVKSCTHFFEALCDIARFHDGSMHPLVGVEERFVCGVGIKSCLLYTSDAADD